MPEVGKCVDLVGVLGLEQPGAAIAMVGLCPTTIAVVTSSRDLVGAQLEHVVAVGAVELVRPRSPAATSPMRLDELVAVCRGPGRRRDEDAVRARCPLAASHRPAALRVASPRSVRSPDVVARRDRLGLGVTHHDEASVAARARSSVSVMRDCADIRPSRVTISGARPHRVLRMSDDRRTVRPASARRRALRDRRRRGQAQAAYRAPALRRDACGGDDGADRRRSRPRRRSAPRSSTSTRRCSQRLGAARVVGVRPESREEANDPDLVAQLDDVTGIFMTGGNQLKLSAIINGTAFGEAIRARAPRAASPIGGTSAGASIQSSHMVAFGTGGSTPKQRMTQLAAGLGLLDGLRDRPALRAAQPLRPAAHAGRPVPQPARHRRRRGHRRDRHATTACSRSSGAARSRSSTARTMTSNAHEAKRTAPLLVSDARLHVLPAGAKFDLMKRALIATAAEVDPDEAEELEVAGADLRQLAATSPPRASSPTQPATTPGTYEDRPRGRQLDDRHRDARPRSERRLRPLTSRSSRRGSIAGRTSGRTTRRSTSSSTSVCSRTGRPTGSPASPSDCSSCCPA